MLVGEPMVNCYLPFLDYSVIAFCLQNVLSWIGIIHSDLVYISNFIHDRMELVVTSDLYNLETSQGVGVEHGV
jgi:hypothetical protein